jgi:DNA-binding protein HU-beta
VNKQQLVDAVAGKLGDGTSKRQVEDTLNTILEEVGDAMRKGEAVQLMGFGTFEPRKRAARSARNPQTGERVRVRATTAPAFKASQKLKDYVGKKPGTARKAAKKTAKKAAKKTTARKTTAKKAGKRSAKKTAKKR